MNWDAIIVLANQAKQTENSLREHIGRIDEVNKNNAQIIRQQAQEIDLLNDQIRHLQSALADARKKNGENDREEINEEIGG